MRKPRIYIHIQSATNAALYKWIAASTRIHYKKSEKKIKKLKNKHKKTNINAYTHLWTHIYHTAYILSAKPTTANMTIFIYNFRIIRQVIWYTIVQQLPNFQCVSAWIFYFVFFLFFHCSLSQFFPFSGYCLHDTENMNINSESEY